MNTEQIPKPCDANADPASTRGKLTLRVKRAKNAAREFAGVLVTACPPQESCGNTGDPERASLRDGDTERRRWDKLQREHEAASQKRNSVNPLNQRYCLNISGELSFKQRIFVDHIRLAALSTPEPQIAATIRHENYHVTITARHWNFMADIVNRFDQKCYCCPSAAENERSIVLAISRRSDAASRRANAAFDVMMESAYGEVQRILAESDYRTADAEIRRLRSQRPSCQ